MRCQVKLADKKTSCRKELVFEPHPQQAAGVLHCPEHPDETKIEVCTCHSCFRNHDPVEGTREEPGIGLWTPNDNCTCVCHNLSTTGTTPYSDEVQYVMDRFSKQLVQTSEKILHSIESLQTRVEKLEQGSKKQ